MSRVPGAPPRVTPEATLAVSKTIAVTPVATRASSALPTRTPATSVMRLSVPKRSSRFCEFVLPPKLAPAAFAVNDVGAMGSDPVLWGQTRRV